MPDLKQLAQAQLASRSRDTGHFNAIFEHHVSTSEQKTCKAQKGSWAEDRGQSVGTKQDLDALNCPTEALCPETGGLLL